MTSDSATTAPRAYVSFAPEDGREQAECTRRGLAKLGVEAAMGGAAEEASGVEEAVAGASVLLSVMTPHYLEALEDEESEQAKAVAAAVATAGAMLLLFDPAAVEAPEGDAMLRFPESVIPMFSKAEKLEVGAASWADEDGMAASLREPIGLPPLKPPRFKAMDFREPDPALTEELALERLGNRDKTKRIAAAMFLLQEPGVGVGSLEAAAVALGKLAEGCGHEVRQQLFMAGVLPPLVRQLGSEDAGCQLAACQALADMLRTPYEEAVVAEGALEKAITLIETGSTECQEQVVRLMHRLAKTHLEAQLAQAGAMAHLLRLSAPGGAASCQQEAVATLRCMLASAPPGERLAELLEQGGVELAVKLLSSSNAGTQEEAAGLLAELDWRDEELVERLEVAGVVEPMVKLLSSAIPACQRPAVTMLRNLSITGADRTRKQLLALGAMEPLLELLSGEDVGCRLQTAGLLKNVTLGNEEMCKQVLKGGGIEPLLELLALPECAAAAAGALRNLAAGAKAAERIKTMDKAGAMSLLVPLLPACPGTTQQELVASAAANLLAADCLKGAGGKKKELLLADLTARKEAVAQESGLLALAGMLQCGHAPCQEAAAVVISHLLTKPGDQPEAVMRLQPVLQAAAAAEPSRAQELASQALSLMQ